jgi:hypothetical protein
MIRKTLYLALFLCHLFPIAGYSQANQFKLSVEEITQKISELRPKESDFIFKAPKGWTKNLANNAGILSVSDGESIDSVNHIIDGLPFSSWRSNHYRLPIEVTIDLGSKQQFNRLVIFNRHTDGRGIGDGNNATKQLSIHISNENDAKSFVSLDDFVLSGPSAVCFKIKGGGQICTFIDKKEPDVFDLNETKARFIKLTFNSAHWGEKAPDALKPSVSMSEIMLYEAQ